MTFEGKPIWAVAATHDVGINFSEENRTFIHRIDPQIDCERAKVVNDLLSTGNVQSVDGGPPESPEERPECHRTNWRPNDGMIAVLVLL